jgi:hypothetical protein
MMTGCLARISTDMLAKDHKLSSSHGITATAHGIN